MLILDPGGTRIQNDGYVRPEIGVWKLTLTVTLRHAKRDPYSNSNVGFDPLTLSFLFSLLMERFLDERHRRKFF